MRRILFRIAMVLWLSFSVWRILSILESASNQKDFARLLISEVKQNSQQAYQSRLSKLRRGCQRWETEMREYFNRSINMTFYVDHGHHLLYCPIPKTGSTTWSYHLVKLAGLEPPARLNVTDIYLLKAQQSERLRTNAKKKFLYIFRSVDKKPRWIEEVLSTVFVRHPFERLVSSFENRIQSHFKGQMLPTILAIYSKRSKVPNVANLLESRYSNVSFEELVDFMLNTPAHELNSHLAPQWMRCPFCTIDFDVLGNLETFDQDVAHIAKQLRLEDLLETRTHKNLANINLEERFSSTFGKLNVSGILGLYKLYEIDFELFGYGQVDEYLRLAADSQQSLEDKDISLFLSLST